MELIYRDLAKFMAETIEDYELRIQVALNCIDHNRCSLQQADYQLYSEMADLVEEYISDNDLDIDPDDIDIETLMFNF
jgi:hypothetical protein